MPPKISLKVGTSPMISNANIMPYTGSKLEIIPAVCALILFKPLINNE